MDRLVEAVAKYLCRHRSVGLLRLTLDLTLRRLAEVGAVEVAKGAAAPPTPGTDAWWRTAVGEAVYALRERGWPSTCGRPRWSTGRARPVDNPPYKSANCEEWRTSPAFFSSLPSRDAEERRPDFSQRRVK